MNEVIRLVTASSQETVRLTRREIAASLQRISRAGPVMDASRSAMDRTKAALVLSAAIIDIANVTESAPLRHSTNSSSSA